jgi:hypothetical protein
MAYEKHTIIKKFEKLLYRAAIDCPKFHNLSDTKLSDCYGRAISPVRSVKNNNHFKIKIKGNSAVSIDTDKEEILLSNLKAQGATPRNMELKVNVPSQVNSFVFTNKELNEFSITVRQDKIIGSYAIVYTSPLIKEKITASVPKEKKIMNFGKGTKGGRSVLKMKQRKCPKSHESNNNGKCSGKYPFPRTLGNLTCCYARPHVKSKGLQIGDGKIFINGKSTSTLTKDQLKTAVIRFKKTMPKKITKQSLKQSLLS